MAKKTFTRGVSGVIDHIFVPDSSSTSGAGLTGVAYNSTNLAAALLYSGGTPTVLTLETISVLGTYAAPTGSGYMRFKEVDATNMPGWYELQYPNDWFSAAWGKTDIKVHVMGASAMAPVPLEYELVGFDIQTATQNVNLVSTSIASIAADAFDTPPGVNVVSISNGTISASTFVASALQLSHLNNDILVGIADMLLTRDWTAVTGEAARSVLNALRFLRNKWSISGTTMTVTKEDDASSAWTSTLTASTATSGISGSDPS